MSEKKDAQGHQVEAAVERSAELSRVSHTPGPWVAFPYTEPFNNADGERMGWHINQAGGAGYVTTIFRASHRAVEDEANVRLIVVAPTLLADLREAAATFRRYESLHLAKGTKESCAKAVVNADLATRFERTIAKATAPNSSDSVPPLATGSTEASIRAQAMEDCAVICEWVPSIDNTNERCAAAIRAAAHISAPRAAKEAK